jgi:hypothetical protein
MATLIGPHSLTARSALCSSCTRHPQSTYCALKARTRSSYAVYLPKLHKRIGSRRIDECDGRDVLQAFDACCEAASGGSP